MFLPPTISGLGKTNLPLLVYCRCLCFYKFIYG